jgi:transmembrane protein TMEM220
MPFRILNIGMALLFALAVIVQYNDPDPVRWMVIYGLACTLSVFAAAGRNVPLVAPIVVGVIALVWGLRLESLVYGRVALGELVQAWEMKDQRVELAREAGGLLIVAGWMTVLAIAGRRRSGRGRPYLQ